MKKLPIKWFAVFSLSLLVVSCTGCSTIRKAYWDHQVDKLCEKDGGVTIFEKLEIRKSDYPSMKLTSKGKLILPPKGKESQGSPFYQESSIDYLRKGSPEVWRYTQSVVRKSDKKILSTYVSYSRVGGDFELGFHPSSHSCKDTDLYISTQSSAIIVKGE